MGHCKLKSDNDNAPTLNYRIAKSISYVLIHHLNLDSGTIY